MFIPPLPRSDADYSLLFIGWDWVGLSLAMVMWSIGMYLKERHQQQRSVNYCSLAVGMSWRMILLGPVSASVTLLMKKNDISWSRKRGEGKKD